MTIYREASKFEDIPQAAGWYDSLKFNSKNKIVEKDGRLYQIIAKKEHTFTRVERIQRILLGTVAVIFTAGFGLASKSVRELFSLDNEKLYYTISKSVSYDQKMWELLKPANRDNLYDSLSYFSDKTLTATELDQLLYILRTLKSSTTLNLS